MKAQPERVSVESLCVAVTSGGTPSRSNSAYWDGGVIPWFKTGELHDWYVEEAKERITEEGLSASSAKLFPPDTVLMAMYGDGKTITTLGLLRSEATTNQACCAMIVDPSKSHFLYLFYALKYHRHELLKLVVAGAQRNLSGGIIRSFKVLCPPLARQRRIAGILSAYDELIENNRRRMALLEEAARQLYREWFVRLHFPGHEHSRITNGVPEGWARAKLGSLLAKIGAKPRVPKEAYLTAGPIPCVDQSADFIGGYTDDEEAAYSAPLPLIVFGDHTRALKFVNFEFARGADGTQLIYPNTEKISPEFLYFALREVDLSNYFYARHFKFLKEKEVPLPAEALVREFTRFAKAVFNQVQVLRLQSTMLRAARDLLLPRLMNGEIAL
jgi:type I restriction enzyme, S subunit